MLIEVRDRVGKLMAAKKTVEEAKAAKPLADLEARWGQLFIHGDFVIDTVYQTHVQAPAGAEKTHGKRPAGKSDATK